MATSMDCDLRCADHHTHSDQHIASCMDITPLKQMVALSPTFSLQPTNQEQTASPAFIWNGPAATNTRPVTSLTKEDEDDIHALCLPTPLPACQSLRIQNETNVNHASATLPAPSEDPSQTSQPQDPILSSLEDPNTDLARLIQKLAWVEASRDEMARLQGQHKGSVAKLEGVVASGERRLMQQASEIESLKAEKRQLQNELCAAKIQANVTPERCRSSLRSLLDESLKAQASAQVNEVAVRKLREMCDDEAREQESLHDFLNIERSALLEQVARLSNDLLSLEGVRAECTRAGESLSGMTAEVESLKAELYYSKEKEVELVAEVTFLAGEVTGKTTALEAARSECERLRSDLERSILELKESKEVGGKIYKQMRAALRALEKHQGTLVKVAPDAAALVKSLADWMSNQP